MKLVRLAAVAALFVVAACTSPTAPAPVLEAGTASASMDGTGFLGGGTRMP